MATTETGAYTLPSIPPGLYRLRTELPGFKTAVSEPFGVQVQQVVRLDVVLQLGQLSDTVEVAATADLLQSETAAVGTVIENKIITFVGDGASNTARSWLFAADKLDFELRIASAKRYQPKPKLLKRAGGRVICTEDLQEAARDADVLYTDIWVSMGREAEEARREAELGPYWINEALVKLAKPDALVMHCLPAHRGQEIDEKTFETHAQTIFDQAENRLHVQKAILAELAKAE